MTEIVKYFSKLDHFSLFASKEDLFARKTETAVSNKKNIEYIYTNSNHSCCFETTFKEVLNKIEK